MPLDRRCGRFSVREGQLLHTASGVRRLWEFDSHAGVDEVGVGGVGECGSVEFDDVEPVGCDLSVTAVGGCCLGGDAPQVIAPFDNLDIVRRGCGRFGFGWIGVCGGRHRLGCFGRLGHGLQQVGCSASIGRSGSNHRFQQGLDPSSATRRPPHPTFTSRAAM
jgi:hypothetical protein